MKKKKFKQGATVGIANVEILEKLKGLRSRRILLGEMIQDVAVAEQKEMKKIREEFSIPPNMNFSVIHDTGEIIITEVKDVKLN